MKKIIVTFFIIYSSWLSIAAAQHLVVFRGLNEQIDLDAVREYAEARSLTVTIFSANQVPQAAKFIRSPATDYYELYGFSLGANSVARLLDLLHKHGGPWPRYTVTIGAHRTANVNFSKYGIAFDNYFDRSGIGNSSPGRMFLDVPHMSLQKHVNQLIINR